MSVRMRLRRMGTRKKAFYRIVVADQRASRDGRFIDLVGTYDPRADPPLITLDSEKAQGWLAKGAQPSDVVRAILARQGLIEKPARPEHAPKLKAEEAPAPAAEAAPAAEPAPEAEAAPAADAAPAEPEAAPAEAEVPETPAAEEPAAGEAQAAEAPAAEDGVAEGAEDSSEA